LKLRPGETVELLMTATASAATVAVSDPPNSASYTTLADFSHTLEWRGVSEVRAFAANGDEIALTPGGRFKMIGEDTHHDYWFAAPGVGCDVPALDGSDPGAAGAGGADPCGTTASGGAGGADGNGEAAAAGGGGMPSTGGAPDGTDTGGETVGGGSNAAGTDSGTSGNDGDRGGYDDGGSSGSMSSSGGVGNRSSGGMVNNPGSDEDNCACRAPGKRSPLSSGVALAAAGLLWMCARRRQKSV
jgi:hypothetical protein